MEHLKTQCRIENHIGFIAMNCTQNLNAIDVAMADELLDYLALCNSDPEVHVVVISGSEIAFSAGGDLGYLYDRIQKRLPRSNDLVERVGRLALYIKTMKKLVITSVCGVAAGAGANLAFSGDFCLAAEGVKFIQAFVGVALVPDTGGAYLLSRTIGSQRALELCITGRPILAEEAHQLGLVYKLYPQEQLAAETLAFATRLARGPLLSYEKIKEQVYAASFADYERYLKNTEEATMTVCAESHDFQEGVCAFIEKRRPVFTGK